MRFKLLLHLQLSFIMYGPFPVVKQVNPIYMKLCLPHTVFHVCWFLSGSSTGGVLGRRSSNTSVSFFTDYLELLVEYKEAMQLALNLSRWRRQMCIVTLRQNRHGQREVGSSWSLLKAYPHMHGTMTQAPSPLNAGHARALACGLGILWISLLLLPRFKVFFAKLLKPKLWLVVIPTRPRPRQARSSYSFHMHAKHLC